MLLIQGSLLIFPVDYMFPRYRYSSPSGFSLSWSVRVGTKYLPNVHLLHQSIGFTMAEIMPVLFTVLSQALYGVWGMVGGTSLLEWWWILQSDCQNKFLNHKQDCISPQPTTLPSPDKTKKRRTCPWAHCSWSKRPSSPASHEAPYSLAPAHPPSRVSSGACQDSPCPRHTHHLRIVSWLGLLCLLCWVLPTRSLGGDCNTAFKTHLGWRPDASSRKPLPPLNQVIQSCWIVTHG